MKKFSLIALALTATAALASCGEKGYSDKVYEAEAGKTMHAVGGYKDDNWKGRDDNKMTATSVKYVAEYSKEVADKLAKKNIEYLYSGIVEIGKTGAGWSGKCKKDGKMYVADGSYAAKALLCGYEETEEVYTAEQWIPDPKTAHCEALTPDTYFIPTWTEAADADGFSWASDSFVTGGAGEYVQVVAKYKEASTPTVAGFGMAFIKIKDIENGASFEEYKPYVASEHTYGVTGSYGTINWDGDTAMTQEGDKYVANVTLAVNDQIKVRADAKWDYSWGFDAMAANSPAASCFANEGGNIKCTVAGTYRVEIGSFTEAAGAVITITQQLL